MTHFGSRRPSFDGGRSYFRSLAVACIVPKASSLFWLRRVCYPDGQLFAAKRYNLLPIPLAPDRSLTRATVLRPTSNLAAENEDIIRAFTAAWASRDLNAVMRFFAEDAVYRGSVGPAFVTTSRTRLRGSTVLILIRRSMR
jgi:hypothetical protein